MSKKIMIVFFLATFVGLVGASDRLAVAEPVVKGGLKPQEAEALWSMLEASVDGGFELISRSALKTMMTEIGLTNSSGLVNLNSSQKARMGEIKSVKYILVPTISKFGSRLNLSLLVINSSTGEIEPDMKESETFDSLDDLADRLDDMLTQIGLGRKARKSGRCAVLRPIVKEKAAPGYLGEVFSVGLQNILLENHIKLFNLQSTDRILKKNKIDNLDQVAPAMYVRIGQLLKADYLIQPTINRFSAAVKKEFIKASNRTVVRCLGNVAGNVRIISSKTGDVIASFNFKKRIDFDDLDALETDDWEPEDYGRYLIENIVPQVGELVLTKLK